MKQPKRSIKVKIKEKIKSRKWYLHLIRLMFWLIAAAIFIFFNAPSIIEGIADYQQEKGDADKLSVRIYVKVKNSFSENYHASQQLLKFAEDRNFRIVTDEEKLKQ